MSLRCENILFNCSPPRLFGKCLLPFRNVIDMGASDTRAEYEICIRIFVVRLRCCCGPTRRFREW